MENSTEKLLFVTKGGAASDEGFCYVLDLARTLRAGIAVLMVHGRKVLQTYEDVMAAVAFAEAGEHQTVKEMMEAQKKEFEEAEAKKINELTRKCKEVSVRVTCDTATGDVSKAVEEFVKARPGVEMVFLSPGLSKGKGSRDIRRLLKRISRPVVTLTRSETAEA